MEKKFTEFGIEEIEGKKVFVATDETVDREGEVLGIDGWMLDNFKRNPVMLWAHNPYDPPIGKWENIRFRTVNGKKKLTMEPNFHGKSELSRLIRDLVEANYPPQTVSVGFRPYEREGNKFTRQELLETSFVNIPANPEATQLALSRGFSEHAVKALTGEAEAKDMLAVSKDVSDNSETPATQEEVAELRKQIGQIITEIKNLGVAVKAKPVSEQQSSAVKGRRSTKEKVRTLLRVANKALDEVSRLSKEDS